MKKQITILKRPSLPILWMLFLIFGTSLATLSAQCPVLPVPDFAYCYDSNESDVVAFEVCPTAGQIATAFITQGDFEAGFDDLTVYSGAMGSGTGGTIVFGPADGDLTGTSLTGAAADDCLIFVSNSDGSISCASGSRPELQVVLTPPVMPTNLITACYDSNLADAVLFEICPAAGGTAIADICSGEFETNFDDLTVYEGAMGSGATGTIVFGPMDGDLSGTNITAAATDVCLIFVANSDGSVSCVSGSQDELVVANNSTTPPPALTPPAFPIDFGDPLVDYDLVDFGGTSSVLGADPTDAANQVLCITKPPGSQCWGGTTIGGNNCLASAIPFVTGSSTINVDVYSPTAGSPILLKVENCTNGGISSEIIVLTTVSNAWETLTFDLSMGCPNPLDLAQVYDKITLFPNFTCDPDACGVTNPGAGSAFSTNAYYFDNLAVTTNPPPPPAAFPIDFDAVVDYDLVDFGGTSSVLGADPTDAANQVLCVTKPPGSQCWGGTTIGGNNCLASAIPFVAGSSTIDVDVYSPTAGSPILLKVENCTNGGISSEIIVLTTVANAWETLTFDLSMGCPNPLDLAQTYDKISLFPNFTCDPDACGVTNPGAGSPFSTDAYYFDNLIVTNDPASPPAGETCMGNVPIENLANGMDYTIVNDGLGNVDITVTVVDNPAGLVGFLGGPGNPISFPDASGTFTYSLTGQADPYVLDMFFNWAAGGQGNSQTVTCDSAPSAVTCTGNVPIENLANGMDYTIVSDASGNVDITVTVVDNPVGLVGFLGGPGNPISFPDATGTFTYNLTGQTVGAPYVLDMFFNWAAGGQGNSETVTVTVNGPCMAADTDVVFCVDFTCFPTPPLNPSVFGTFNGFNPAANPVTDPDGDGIYCTTITLPPGDYEYLFFETNEGAEAFAPGDPCTVSNFGFTNRLLTVGGTSPQMENFGWGSCDQNCVAPVPAPEIPINFDDPLVDYNLVDFGGTNSVIGADPTDASNPVLCITKPPGSQCWAGTTIGGDPTCLENPIQFSAGNMVLSVDVYSPVAGAPILLKVENCMNGGISSEIIALTTVANAWETLAFDFSMGCGAPVDLGQTYNQLTVFPNFVCDPDACGNPNPGAGSAFSTASFYFDNIMFCDQSLAPEITCPADVTVNCDASTDPADTGMATATDLCSVPTITFADVSTQGTGCDAYNYTITRTWTATDNLGNTATCEQIITVQDITPPVLTCPVDASIECDGDSTPAGTGMAIATDNCSTGADLVVSFVDVSTQGTDGCAQFEYMITRTWTAVDACGLSVSCDQIINVGSTTPATVTCPADEMLECNQTPPAFGDTPEEFLAIGGTLSDNCSTDLADFTVTHSDDTSVGFLDFCPSSAPADRTIIRTYTITNACGNVTTCTQNFVFGTSNIGPVITSIPLDQTVDCAVNAIAQEHLFVAEGTCSNLTYSVSGPSSNGTAGCPGNTIQYVYTVTDECGRFATHVQTYTLTNEGPEFVCPVDICVIECPANTDMIQAQFDAYAGLATVISSCSETSISISNNFNPNGFIPQNCMNPVVQVEGAVSYQIVTFTAADICGRTSNCTALVVIKDNEGPEMTGSVSVGVADCNDSDLQSGYTNWAMSQLSGLSATDVCSGADPTLSYSPLSPNVDCSSGLATTVVSFTAVDPCGNVTTLTANYQIIDLGTGEPATATVSGTLMTEESEMVALAEVEVDGFMNNMMMTSTDGYYHFDLMASQNYAITPSRNDDPMNGITTYDLILMGQHILEINQLDSPYKMIAADVNESGSITTLDLIELRRLILHIDDAFSSGKSWTFVDAAYTFPNPLNPFATTYPTVYNINNLTSSQIVDFIGVKLGDLNASASPNLLQSGDTRSSDGELKMKLEDELLKAGQTYQLAFNASDFKDVAGFQFTLDFAADYLEVLDFEGSELSNMSANNFGFNKANEGKLTVSWNDTESVNMADDATLFQVSFTALKDVQLSEVLAINSSVTANEAYQADLRKDVVLDFGNAMVNKGFTLLQNQPNPFSQETVIGFQLPEASEATLTIYDVSGRVVYTRTNMYEAGLHQVMMDKADLGATGVLYYQLSTSEFNETKKMIVLK